MLKKLKSILSIIALLISVMGIITFSLFIFEEALQTVMFGTWAAQDAHRWDIVQKGVDINRSINRTMKIVNWCFGWIQPFAFMAYGAYGKSMDYYLDCLEAKAVANAPELYIGRKISLSFVPKRIEIKGNQYILKNGRIWVTTVYKPTIGQPIQITGMIEQNGAKIIIRNDDENQ